MKRRSAPLSLLMLLTLLLPGVEVCGQTEVEGGGEPEFAPPALEFVMELRVTCGEPYDCGTGSSGRRVVIPITGGTFAGPKVRGEVLPGGADYQLVDSVRGRVRLEALYALKASDGEHILVRNAGLLIEGREGIDDTYFRTSPTFEAPADGPLAWLNDALFLCQPVVADGYISLQVWRVK